MTEAHSIRPKMLTQCQGYILPLPSLTPLPRSFILPPLNSILDLCSGPRTHESRNSPMPSKTEITHVWPLPSRFEDIRWPARNTPGDMRVAAATGSKNRRRTGGALAVGCLPRASAALGLPSACETPQEHSVKVSSQLRRITGCATLWRASLDDVWRRIVLCYAMLCSSMPYHAIPCHAMPCHATVLYDML